MNRDELMKNGWSAEHVPLGSPNDFCIPEECCPEKIETEKYPSPNSCLPQEELEELEANIDMTNRILLDLALSGEELEEEGRRRAFEGLLSQYVIVNFDCGEAEGAAAEDTLPINIEVIKEDKKPKVKKKIRKRKKNRLVRKIRKKPVKKKQADNDKDISENVIEGRVKLVGRNFVLLEDKHQQKILNLNTVCSIKPGIGYELPEERRDLEEIDPCLRRALTFQFGETVASSPELIQIFYRLPLHIFLLLLLDRDVKIVMNDGSVAGTLIEVFQDSIIIDIKGSKKHISIDNICYLVN